MIVESWDAIRSRRDVRTYRGQPIAPADLDRILEAAWRAPSSNNQQRWDFVVCTDRRRLQELARVWQYGGHVATSAATIALVAPDDSGAHTRESIQFDLGQASMSIMLAAADLGIGSGPLVENALTDTAKYSILGGIRYLSVFLRPGRR